MKKILLSVLSGLMVAGSAFAEAPTIEDRRALCEKYPDKFVWVEPTQVCLPINPCTRLSGLDAGMDAYCIGIALDGSETDDQIDILCRRTLEEQQNSKIKSVGNYKDEKVTTYYMENGMYLACERIKAKECVMAESAKFLDAYKNACSEMGGIFKQSEFEHAHGCENITTIDMCQDLADRVSLNCGCHVFIDRVAGFDEEERTCNLWMDHGTCADY